MPLEVPTELLLAAVRDACHFPDFGPRRREEIADFEGGHAPSVRQDLGRRVRALHTQERVEPRQTGLVPPHSALRDPGTTRHDQLGSDAILFVRILTIVGIVQDGPGLQREGPQPRVGHGKVRPVEDRAFALDEGGVLGAFPRPETAPPADSRIDDALRRHDRLGRQWKHVQHRRRLGEWQRPQNFVPDLLIRHHLVEVQLHVLLVALVGGEEEHLVAKHGPAECAAVLMERADRLCRRGEKVAGVEFLVLAAVERRTVERVRARSADHIDLSAGDPAVFRRQHSLDDLDLGDGVEAHDRDLILAAVLGHRPGFGTRVGLGAIDCDARAARGDAVHLHVSGAARAHAGCQAHQVCEVPAIDRQLAHFLHPEAVGLQRGRRLDERTFRRHRHRLREATDLEGERLPHRRPAPSCMPRFSRVLKPVSSIFTV